MKHTLLITTLLLAAAPAALAWPFTEHNTGSNTLVEAPLQGVALQTDTDRVHEYYNGGTAVLQMTAAAGGGLTAQQIRLPLPDIDPYTGNVPVTWQRGRGDAGDIDNDGDTDIVYSSALHYNGLIDSVNVRIVACLNNGDGTWTRHWQFKTTAATVRGAPEVKLADFDHDGDLDLAETANGLRIRLNNGGGDFSTALPLIYGAYPTMPGLSDTPEFEVADFDGNGWPDIALFANVRLTAADPQFTLTGRLTLLSNDGGTFTAATVQTNPAQNQFRHSAAADLDDDGRLDLLATRGPVSGATEMQWFRNTGSGFAAGVQVLSLTSAQAPFSVSFLPGDVDEDDTPDIVFSAGSGKLEWLRGTGGGTFSPAAVLRASSNNNPPYPIGLADMDGDGDNDIMADAGRIFLENRAIRMRSAASVTPFSGINPTGTVDLTVGDVNNDGKDDLIATDGGGQRIRWYAGNGTGLDASFPIGTGNLTPVSVAAGDFNKDGWTDLAWSAVDSPIATLTLALSSNGSGIGWTFTKPASMFGMSQIIADDMDRDGDPDILAASPSGGFISWHVNNSTAINWSSVQVDSGLPTLSTIATGQIVPGRRPEVVALTGSTVSHYRYNNGNWTYGVFANSSGSTASSAAVVAEIDDAYAGPETIFALNSNSVQYDHEAHPGLPVNYRATSGAVKTLVAVDWTGDGLTDVLLGGTNGVTLISHKAPGVNGIPSSTDFPVGSAIQDIVTMDLDGDRFPDAVAVDTTGQLHLIYNRAAAMNVEISSDSPRHLPAGASDKATSIRGAHQGDRNGETAAAPASMSLRFLRSSLSGSVDSPGSVLTQPEVSALVENLTLVSGGTTLATAVPSVSAGLYTFIIPAAARTQLKTERGMIPSTFELHVRLKSTAGSAAVSRFYVEYSPASAWVPLDDSGNSGPSALRLIGTTDIQRTLFTVRAPTLLDTWRLTNFGTYDTTGPAANDADPDGDRIPNLLEYVSAQDPNSATGIGAGPVVGLTRDFGIDAMVADLRLLTTYDSKVRLTLQYSVNPAVSWSQISTRTGTGAWSLAPISTTLLSGGSRTRFEFDGGNPATFPKAFYRLKAEELP